jgi:hypothetical protein
VLHYFVCGFTGKFTRLRVQGTAWILRIQETVKFNILKIHTSDTPQTLKC